MKITSIRLGFATNSSSSHSVVFGGSRNKKEIHETYDGALGRCQFGWENEEWGGLNTVVNYGIMLGLANLPEVISAYSRGFEHLGDAHSSWQDHKAEDFNEYAFRDELEKHSGLRAETIDVLCRFPWWKFHYIDHESMGGYGVEGSTLEDQFWEFVATVDFIQGGNDNDYC